MRKFMRTRGAVTPPPPLTPALTTLKTNGHANGVGPAGDDHSSVSRYWSGSESPPPAHPAPLWEDPQFPAAWRSIGDKKLAAGVLWLRPYELCSRPTFRGEQCSSAPAPAPAANDESDAHFAARWSVQVGAVGDASLCCAAAALALTPRLLDRVAPPQTFRPPYTGTFRFKFWVFGTWRDVTVDDRLPTRGGVLMSSRGALHDDFTLPLLEKAYAKLYGSYAALRAGSVARALQDLSGGIVQSFSLARQARALTAQVLHSAVPRSTLLVATTGGHGALTGGTHTLPPGRAYCVTGLARVRGAAGAGGGDDALVRMRSACASASARWSGAWSRGSAEWRALPDADRELLARRADRPGDFWMSLGDLTRVFSALVLVHVGPDDWLSETALQGKRPWRAVLARRRWRRGYNAGGPPSCIETTGTNPQFHVQVPSGGAHKVHVVVSVTQQYRCGEGVSRLHGVGFAVYELPRAAHPRPHHALHALRALDVTHECRAREVVTFFTLPPGQYLVVPHTRRPHTDAAFLLRILTDEQTHVWEVNEDNVIIHDLALEFPRARDRAGDDSSASVEHGAAAADLRAGDHVEEVDASALRSALRQRWGWWGRWGGPSLDLCRALLPLRDVRVRGVMRAADVPALAALVWRWREVYATAAGAAAGGCAGGECSSYRLRALLRAAGVCASNKVLECLVLRFVRRTSISADAYVLALARLYLAHERYRSLDTKLKSNPLSLEEMILMTIYS